MDGGAGTLAACLGAGSGEEEWRVTPGFLVGAAEWMMMPVPEKVEVEEEGVELWGGLPPSY